MGCSVFSLGCSQTFLPVSLTMFSEASKKTKSRIMQSGSLKHTHFSVYGYKCVSLWLEPMLGCSQSSDSLLSSSFRQKCAALEWSTRKWNRVWQLVSERRPENYGRLFRAVLLRVHVCLRVRKKKTEMGPYRLNGCSLLRGTDLVS